MNLSTALAPDVEITLEDMGSWPGRALCICARAETLSEETLQPVFQERRYDVWLFSHPMTL